MEFRVSPLYYRDSVATKRFDSLQRFKDETLPDNNKRYKDYPCTYEENETIGMWPSIVQ
jgi:hypothetical protein